MKNLAVSSTEPKCFMTREVVIMAKLQHALLGRVKHAVSEGVKNNDVAIRTRIRERMADLEINVAALAKGAKVTKSAVYQWLDGTTEPSIVALVNLAPVLKTYEKWIVTGHGPKDRGALVALEPDEAALLLSYRELNPDTKSAVYAVALQLSQSEKKKSEGH